MPIIKETAPGLGIDTAELVGLLIEGPLYGAFVVLDIMAINILTYRRRHSNINPFFVTAAVLMMLLSTAQFVVDATTIGMGFIPIQTRPERESFFLDLTQPIYAARHAIYFAMMLVGDAIVIYRCYIVWNKNFWIVLLPILCSLASGACSFQTIWAVRHLNLATNSNPGRTTFLATEVKLGFSTFGASFSANFIATSKFHSGLISWKIWAAERNMRRSLSGTGASSVAPPTFTPVLRILLETGIVNTLYLLAYTIVLDKGTNGIQIMASIVTPLVGIIFTTVIIRAALASEESARETHQHSISRVPPMFAANDRSTTINSNENTVDLGSNYNYESGRPSEKNGSSVRMRDLSSTEDMHAV